MGDLNFMKEFFEVFRHPQPFVAEITRFALQKKGINCFMQQGSLTGLGSSKFAAVADKALEYVVYVHKVELERATKIIDKLPLNRKPFNVSLAKSPNRKRQILHGIFKIVATIIPIFVILFIFM